jgi:hypothetical protein
MVNLQVAANFHGEIFQFFFENFDNNQSFVAGWQLIITVRMALFVVAV